MNEKTATFLTDVLDCVGALEAFVSAHTRADLDEQRMFRSAVMYEFAVIGEALAQIRKIDPDITDHVTDARKIIAFRNLIVHGYREVINERVWDVLTNHLPVFKAEVQRLLSKGPEH